MVTRAPPSALLGVDDDRPGGALVIVVVPAGRPFDAVVLMNLDVGGPVAVRGVRGAVRRGRSVVLVGLARAAEAAGDRAGERRAADPAGSSSGGRGRTRHLFE